MTDRISDRELARRLRIARRDAGVSLSRAAAAAGMADNRLCRIESGHKTTPTRVLMVLAHLYGTSCNRLLRKEAVWLDKPLEVICVR